jgi:hypothetical protein
VTTVCALALFGCFFVTVRGVVIRGVRSGQGVLRDVLGGQLLMDDLPAGACSRGALGSEERFADQVLSMVAEGLNL